MADAFTRYESFVERYVIERAQHFRAGHEQEDGWHAIQDARAVYGMIQADSARVQAERDAADMNQRASGAGTPMTAVPSPSSPFAPIGAAPPPPVGPGAIQSSRAVTHPPIFTDPQVLAALARASGKPITQKVLDALANMVRRS